MRSRSFEKISVQDIAEAATVNRATFYDHYVDKFALLDGLVSARFDALLLRRGIAFDGSCAGPFSAMILAVCDYLASLPRPASAERPEAQSYLEAAVVGVVRRELLAGMSCESCGETPTPMIAAAASWAIYGAAKEWLRQPDRCPSERIVATIAALASPILATASWLHADPLAERRR